jgi:nifR3 family TIM-barrel protein
MSFWNDLKKPIMVLAPMADVTDAAFRRIIAKYSRPGGPAVFWSEFVSADGLYHTREIQKMPDSENPLMMDLLFSETEHPIVAQLFTSKPPMMEYAARLAVELGFDGVDINMGCPDRSIEKQHAGAALIKDPTLATELVEAARRGIASVASEIPVSVKTRIGYSKREELEEWIPQILSSKPAVLTIHARTRKEMSDVPARWEHVARTVEIRDTISPETLIFGNGDALSVADAEMKAKDTGADGVMLGRAIFGNPWLFSKETSFEEVPLEVRFRVMIEHTKLFRELLPHKNFAIMKKHYKAYVNGFDGAKELRVKLMEAKDPEEVEKIALDYLA